MKQNTYKRTYPILGRPIKTTPYYNTQKGRDKLTTDAYNAFNSLQLRKQSK